MLKKLLVGTFGLASMGITVGFATVIANSSAKAEVLPFYLNAHFYEASPNESVVDSLSFSEFDSSIGVLTSVDVIYTGTLQVDGNLWAVHPLDYDTTGVWWINSWGTVSATEPDIPTTHNLFDGTGVNEECYTQEPDILGCVIAQVNYFDLSHTITYSGADLLSFIGTGEWDVEFNMDIWSDAHTVGEWWGYWFAEGTVEVVYHFDSSVQIPEPATLALFGIGLAGIGFTGRRRRKAA